MKTKIGIVSLGCAKNLVDSELMLGNLKNDYEITSIEEEADVIIINTCAFIESAIQESIDTILEMAQYKQKKCKAIIVTGCLAERYKDEVINEIPEVDAIIGTGNYDKILTAVKKVLNGCRYINCIPNLDISYLDSERVITTGKAFAYLKIAEGCDNYCSYCVIPSIRGKFRSRKLESILGEAERLVNSGYREIVLVAQDTSRYGLDIYRKKMLATLLKELSKIKNLSWIRLLYCYPEAIDDELIAEISSNDKVCKYIDIPIQHISDNILKKMNRKSNSLGIIQLIKKIRTHIPEIILRTSIIVGFPGETQEEFNELCNFIKETKFDRLGVFKYSREENTPAARLNNQINENVKSFRYDKIMQLQKEISRKLNLKRLNKIYTTIVEGVAEDGIFYYGRTYAESPDVDSKVFFTSIEPLNIGDFVNVKVLNAEEYDLIGEVVHEFTE